MTLEGEMQALQVRLRQQHRWKTLNIAGLISGVFQSEEGSQLLAILCELANPIDQSFRHDARESDHAAGQREVVALLWRYGSAMNSVPTLQPTTPNTHEKEE